ncbi:hypothetical protein [Sphingomonas sp. PAMC 26605]|uniref:hypothetical protein n=1 Tax=Sphingomonas sp. PAMC 26605 TaxID=1112214 RepID=UPI001E426616|nr:hypothetical protein [Sphingomonas sp. PAMC 26605]
MAPFNKWRFPAQRCRQPVLETHDVRDFIEPPANRRASNLCIVEAAAFPPFFIDNRLASNRRLTPAPLVRVEMPNDQPPAPIRPWRDSLTLVVVVFILWNAIILWLLYTGATDHEVGNDAAGAGMGRGFREIFATASAIGIAVLALPAIIVQHRGVRITFIGLLGIASCLTPMML